MATRSQPTSRLTREEVRESIAEKSIAISRRTLDKVLRELLAHAPNERKGHTIGYLVGPAPAYGKGGCREITEIVIPEEGISRLADERHKTLVPLFHEHKLVYGLAEYLPQGRRVRSELSSATAWWLQMTLPRIYAFTLVMKSPRNLSVYR